MKRHHRAPFPAALLPCALALGACAAAPVPTLSEETSTGWALRDSVSAEAATAGGRTEGTADDERGMAASGRSSADRGTIASVESLRYDSPFADHGPLDAAEPPDWIGVNRRVGEVGGWQSYAREIYRANKAREAAEEDGDRPRESEVEAESETGTTREGDAGDTR